MVVKGSKNFTDPPINRNAPRNPVIIFSDFCAALFPEFRSNKVPGGGEYQDDTDEKWFCGM